MKITIEQALEDAVHVRAWIQRLNRGDKIIMIPGSADHARLLNVITYLEDDMKQLMGRTAPRASMRRESVNPSTIRVRRMRSKKASRIHRLVDKYFQVHGEEYGPTKNDEDAAQAVPQGPECLSIL